MRVASYDERAIVFSLMDARMGTFRALIGDMFASDAQTLVNTVNCVGVMGKGVAAEFKKRFPAMFEDYAQRCAGNEVRLGEPYLYRDPSGTQIVNFPTKDHWRSPARLRDIESGLDYLIAHLSKWAITSLALPPLGCGNGGLDWSDVGPLIYRKLHTTPVDILLFAPYGTPKTELTEQFLAAPSQRSFSDAGRKAEKLNPNWIVLMEVLRELEAQPYANPVGRTIFQKIAYVVTMLGVPTNFQFDKGSYGPFSQDVKAVLHDFSNRNWLNEQQLGRMIALRSSNYYEKDRRKFTSEIEKHARQIAKTVDLFSRIKSTEQAEEVVTVLFAGRQLKQKNLSKDISEQELYEFILDWKKSWATEEKKRAVASAIRNLVLLGWIRLKISEAMIEAA